MVNSESCSFVLIVRNDIDSGVLDSLEPSNIGAVSMLISFEGGDRCGKTTQIAILKKKLEDLSPKVVALKHPNRTTASGKIIDEYLKKKLELSNEAVTLCLTSNLWETS